MLFWWGYDRPFCLNKSWDIFRSVEEMLYDSFTVFVGIKHSGGDKERRRIKEGLFVGKERKQSVLWKLIVQ